MKIICKNKKIIFLIIIVFLISYLLRVILIDSIPQNINPDEADTLRTFLTARHTNNPSFFSFNWNGAPAINAYLIGFFWELFHRSIFGLRFASILISSLSVVLFFILSYKLVKRIELSFVLSLALASNPWFLNFSRSGWENIFNSFSLLIIFVGFYFLYQKNKLKTAIVLLVLGSVLGFYFYHPGKLFLPITMLILFTLMNLKRFKIHVFTFIIFAFISLSLIIPQLLNISSRNNSSLSRITNVSILNQPNSFKLFQNNFKRNITGFLFFNKNEFDVGLNARYIPLNSNPINPFLTIFYLVGLLVALIEYPYYFMFYIFTLLPIELLSLGTPDAARAVHIAPVIFIFILLGIDFFLRKIKKYYLCFYKNTNLIIFLLIVIIIFVQTSTYFSWITKQSTLAGREPAIWKQEYNTWLNYLEKSLILNRVGFTVDEWKKLKKSFK